MGVLLVEALWLLCSLRSTRADPGCDACTCGATSTHSRTPSAGPVNTCVGDALMVIKAIGPFSIPLSGDKKGQRSRAVNKIGRLMVKPSTEWAACASRRGPYRPPALQRDPGGKPGAYRSQCPRPGRCGRR